MRRAAVSGVLMLAALLAGRASAAAQGSLAEAAERVRRAWLAHDAAGVIGAGPALILQIPGADPSVALERAQAVELVRRYVAAEGERGLSVRGVREVEPGHGYVELERRYVVAGTVELRRETMFLGFRKSGDEWQLSELRCAP